MTRTELYEEEIRTELGQLKAELDSLQEKIEAQDAGPKEKLDDYIDSLSDKREQVGKKLENLKDASSDAVDEIRSGLTEAWERLAIAKQAAKAKFH